MSTKAELHEKITQLTQEHLEAIGGGLSCSPDDLVGISESIVTVYENLVDATSHIIERVLGP
jgi:ribulose-5-phosphate 4-epimerase/fuculose-1-phosphate aldolase